MVRTSVPCSSRCTAKAWLRDQDRLHEKCVELQDGFSFVDWLNELNRRVFFWSGWPDRPVESGRNARDRYHDSDAIIRFPFRQMANDLTPYFTRCNSGATRMQHGRRVLRGPRTFLQAMQCDFPPSEVVEVTFVQPVELPHDSEVSLCQDGLWNIL
jgi:hypothetical protein